MKSFKQYISEIKEWTDSILWVLNPTTKQLEYSKETNRNHSDVFPHLMFNDTSWKSDEPDIDKPVARAWGRIDPKGNNFHIVTQSSGLSPNPRNSKKAMEDDVFSRIEALKHLKKQYPGHMVHASDNEGVPKLMTISEYEKHITGHLKQ